MTAALITLLELHELLIAHFIIVNLAFILILYQLPNIICSVNEKLIVFNKLPMTT